MQKVLLKGWYLVACYQPGYVPVLAICIKRATRSSVGGWVENKPAKPPPARGLMIII
jgi:hypothetical protein